MKEFFSNMDSTLQIYWYIAIAASIIFIIQTIMTFMGADSDTGVDADFDSNFDDAGSSFQLFSLRNLINFLLGLGWAGVGLYYSFDNKIILSLVAALIGCVFVALFFFIMRAMMRLAEDNSFNIEDTVGKTADVYTNIPANNKGKGKVFVSVNGSTRELTAMNPSDMDLKTGMVVRITALEDNMLIVKPI